MGRTCVTKTNRIPAVSAEARKRTRTAVVSAVAAIKSASRNEVHVDTGDTRDSLRGNTPTGFQGEVYTPQWDAHFQEFGTVEHPAKPFLGPAAEEARPGFEADMRKVVDP